MCCKWFRLGSDEPLCANPEILKRKEKLISITELVYGKYQYTNCMFERKEYVGRCKHNAIFFESKE